MLPDLRIWLNHFEWYGEHRRRIPDDISDVLSSDERARVASSLATFLFGVAVGNAMRGMPIGVDREFQGTFWSLLHPYALLVGAFATVAWMVLKLGRPKV